MLKHLRDFLYTRSLSFRLYLLIVPTTILAISLLGYLDSRVSMRMLDAQVQSDTLRVATQLAEDLRFRGASVSPQSLLPLLYELLEANLYITRINVYRLSGDDITLVVSTSISSSSLPSQRITVDELTAMSAGRTLIVPQFQDRERLLKIIVPFSNAATPKGCVSVVSTLRLSDFMRDVHEKIALFLIPGTVLVLILMLHQLFTRGITRRIDRLVQTMSQAQRGNLQKRAAVERKDELGIIAERFNEMMEEIERASRQRDRLLEEQKDFNAQLRGKVREATHELSSANAQLRQVNEDLVETQRRLTQSERAAMVGQMAATFAHEIGSPLSAISTHLQLMEEGSATSDETRRRLRLIHDQVNRITGFVEELLSETRASMQARSAVQLNRLLQQLLLFLDQHLQKHHVNVETHFGPDLPEIEANAQQLQQVFLNLLNNACDAMPDGGTVRVTTSTETSPEGVSYAVAAISDNGIGIPPEKQERIFEPFFTTKDLRRGTGLGLSIAAKIIRQHQGTISLRSAPNAGTTFTIRFLVSVPASAGVNEAFAGDQQL